MRSLIIAALLLVPALLCQAISSDTSSSPHHRRPLDLPTGGRGSSEDDEDTPEAIALFGHIYESDAFYFLLDRSGSMSLGRLDLLKEEMTRVLDSLSRNSEFTIVSFASDVTVFSRTPVRARLINKVRGKSWVDAMVATGATHMLDGATELLSISRRSRVHRRAIIAVGDGAPNSPQADETLVGILAENVERLPFHTVLLDGNEQAHAFMQQLASQTGGTFREIGTGL